MSKNDIAYLAHHPLHVLRCDDERHFFHEVAIAHTLRHFRGLQSAPLGHEGSPPLVCNALLLSLRLVAVFEPVAVRTSDLRLNRVI